MRLVAFEIADDAHDPHPDGTLPPPDVWPFPWSAMPIEGEFRRNGWKAGLVERCGMSARAISRTLADLAAAGYDLRQAITGKGGDPVRDKRGRLVYAAKGHALRFAVPYLAPRPVPQRSPIVATFDAAQTSSDHGESLPEVASIDPQRSPVLVPKVAGSGDPVPHASPNIKVFPQAAAARLAEDQDQTQDQSPNRAGGGADGKQVPAGTSTGSQSGSVANLQNRQVNNGSDNEGSQAQGSPLNDSERATAGTGTRARADPVDFEAERRRQMAVLETWMNEHPEAS